MHVFSLKGAAYVHRVSSLGVLRLNFASTEVGPIQSWLYGKYQAGFADQKNSFRPVTSVSMPPTFKRKRLRNSIIAFKRV